MVYKSTLKQEPVKILDLNYSRYLDFSNAVVMNDANQEYTTTSKGMVFNNGYSDSWQQEFRINDIPIISQTFNVQDGSLIDALSVSSGVKITKYGVNGHNFGTVMFVPFTDQTIAVPNFSKMVALTDGQIHKAQSNECLLLQPGTSVRISYNNVPIQFNNRRRFQYLMKDMIAAISKSYVYYMPIEE